MVGSSVTAAVLSILNSGHLLRNIDLTHIALIPKHKNPDKMSDFRPISLCNVIYKIISKVLANRLKAILSSIISDSQSAFVPRRFITENVTVAFETLNSLRIRRSSKKAYMALKLDMSKAYDRVEWRFLELFMRKIGFADNWVNFIMECIQSVNYSVLIDGEPTGFIRLSRGLRQKDPLSPYLFLLCIEGLTSLIRQAELDGHIFGVATCRRRPKVSHLFFTDDNLLFCKATISNSTKIMEILSLYEHSLGQKINREKFVIFFSSNTP